MIEDPVKDLTEMTITHGKSPTNTKEMMQTLKKLSCTYFQVEHPQH